VVQRGLVVPPRSRVGAIAEQERAAVLQSSLYGMKYANAVDNISAAEMIEEQHRQEAAQAELDARQAELDKAEAKRQAEAEKAARKTTSSRSRTQKNPFDEVINTASTTVGREIGKSIVRGLLGSLKR
jgi:hypothetical protein